MAATTLLQLYNKHKKGDWPDKNSVHSYIQVYEEILAPYRHTAKNIIEIGLMSGESLRMWTDYFDGKVWGMDCSETPIDGLADLRPIIAEGFPVVIGDAANKDDLKNYFEGIKFDVVIEDAGHDIGQQLMIRAMFFNYGFLATGGIYIVEDVQDVDKTADLFIDLGGTILDLRKNKGRYDDVLVIFNK